jgi:TolB-like protein
MIRILIAVAVVSLALPTTGAAQERTAGVPVIAVLDFHGASIMPGDDAAAIASGFAAMLTTELGTRAGIRVVERQVVENLIRTQQLSATGRVDDARAVRMAELLGADYVVLGNVMLMGREARLDLKLEDPFTGEIIKVDKRSGSRDDFLNLAGAIADAFSTGVPAPPRGAVAAAQAPAPAVLAYSRGLDFERRRMTARAAEMYRTALELFPDYKAAADALGRVNRGGRR